MTARCDMCGLSSESMYLVVYGTLAGETEDFTACKCCRDACSRMTGNRDKFLLRGKWVIADAILVDDEPVPPEFTVSLNLEKLAHSIWTGMMSINEIRDLMELSGDCS